MLTCLIVYYNIQMLAFSNENFIVILLENFEGKSNYSWFGCSNKHEETKY